MRIATMAPAFGALLLLWLQPNAARAGDEPSYLAPALAGHRLELLPDGAALVARRHALVAAARRSIYVSTYAFKDDAASRAAAAALCAQAQRGLDVRVFVDHRGGAPFLARGAEALRACGARVLSYDPLDWDALDARYTLHEKLLVVDGEHAIIGGSGYADWYDNASPDSTEWHDLDLALSGPAACWFQLRFMVNWKRTADWEIHSDRGSHAGPEGEARYERTYGLKSFAACARRDSIPNDGPSRVYPLQQNPLYETSRWPLKTEVAAIRAATRSIQLYSAYLDPSPELADALLDARKRGVSVTILTNSESSTDEPSAYAGMLRKAPALLAAGVEILEWGRKGVFHRKGGIFDGRFAFLGSDNLDCAASRYNSETVAFTDDEELVAGLGALFEADRGMCRAVTREQLEREWNDEPLWRKIALPLATCYL